MGFEITGKTIASVIKEIVNSGFVDMALNAIIGTVDSAVGFVISSQVRRYRRFRVVMIQYVDHVIASIFGINM